MTRRRIVFAVATACAAFTLDAGTAEAQSIGRRVEEVRDGMVRFEFPSRPGLCGHQHRISTGRNRNQTTTWTPSQSRDVEWEADCERGPVRVVLELRRGEITDVRSFVGGKWRPVQGRVTDLGSRSSREAVDYLLTLVAALPARTAEKAIFPSTIGEGIEVWPSLIRMARDSSRPREVRRQALFWVGQAAGDAVTATLDGFAGDNSVDREVREQAIFALSQRPRDEGVPALIRIARTNRDRELRKKALFWLGQSGDARAIALFEEILSRR